jgi:hypothetical protein
MARSIRSAGLLTAAALAASLTAAPLTAQGGPLDPQCAASSRPLQDACQKSVDLFDFMAPQLGTAVAGGNAIIGQGGAYGRIGRLTIGLRATAFEGSLPEVQNSTVSTAGAQASNFEVSEQYIGAPALDAAVGLFPGIGLGPVRVGALDVLATATYIPEYESDEFSVLTPGGSVKLGYGARLGLVQETGLLPGVAVTYLRRDLPSVDLLGIVAASGSALDDTLGVRSLEVETQAWRVVAGKRLSILGVSVGAGQVRYESGARLGAVVNETVLGFPIDRFESREITLAQTLTRTNYFANVALNLPGVRIAGEVGRAQGGRVRASYNSFQNGAVRADDDILYFGAAVRIGM